MAGVMAPWPGLARSGSPPAFYDIMENRRPGPVTIPTGGISLRRVRLLRPSGLYRD
ncbi:hypothetical protein BO78DRAFT_116465 [Aspergillus sclerotiicarbonarius CBS 121057]|uniref:Uncharacterized protein n=1 Tax=Aspergillus sclerotiicarbonarius (strain CBS 121057 / IBT 28362) TaxID=1448318 RepID=A0A319E8R1_ASPSB|nr:hypothetical protein BO78DRAFT_116465 [Aspergillus sclerotiicarbonarius CBS 121057]